MSQSPTRDDILDLEHSYWEAIKAKDGTKTAQLSGQTALVTGARGVTAIAKDKMGAMTEDGEWELLSYYLDNVEVVVPHPDVAIIAYTVRQSVLMDGQTKDMHAADSSTWLRGPDGWECHAHSEAPLQQAPDKI